MRVEGSFITPGEGYRLFRVWSRWLGGDLTDNYTVRAAIRTSADDQGPERQVYWYVPLGAVAPAQEGTPFLWEFHAPSDSPKEIWMRVYFRPKNSKEDERWVDFRFPYFQAEDSTSPAFS